MTPRRDHLARTLSLGLPLVGSQLAQILIGTTDTLMLGRYSVGALAASVLGASFFISLFLLASGPAIAVMGVSSDAAGRGDERSVRRAARMSLWLSVAAGVALLPLFWMSGRILLALDQPPAVAADAQSYLRVAMWGLVPALLTMTLRSHLSALEHTRVVLWATLAAAGLNVGLNWLLIFGNAGAPELGIRGAAVASVAVHLATAAVLALYAARGPDMARWELYRNPLRPDWEMLLRLFRLGWPIGLTLLAEVGLFSAAAVLMGTIGTVPLAAHGIAIQIASATFMIHLGLSQAATVRVGRFAGQGEPGELRRAALAVATLSGIAVLASMALFLAAGPLLVGLFLDASDPAAAEIHALGVRLLMLAALFQLVDAAQVIALGCLRGLQDTRRPMVLAFVSYWIVGLPAGWALAFPFGLGPEGVWVGLVLGLALASVTLTARFVRLAPRDAAAAAAG